MVIVLKYVGDGSALPGLPARDVTAEEIRASGYQLADLLASGLYVKAASKPETKKEEK